MFCVRFGLSELQLLCEQYMGNPVEDPREQDWDASLAREPSAEPQQSLADHQFLELLRSMWEHEDVDGEEVVEAKRGTEGEDEEDSRDGEIKEDIVNEDELNEIYEFAATQRKVRAEAEVNTESGEEEDEGVNNCSDAEQRDVGKQSVKMEDATDMHCSADVDLSPASHKNVHQSRGPDASLDRSYNRLFSESWGQYVEPSQTQTQHLDLKNTPTSRRTSSVSEVIDLSISPPAESGEPARSLFPVTGVSPGEVPGETPDQSEAVQQPLTSESPNAHGISQLTAERSELWSKHPSTSAHSKTQLEVTPSLPISTKPKLSPSTPNRSQPELIILSDSSDDMDHDPPGEVPSRGDAPRPPTASPSRLSLRYTHIKAKETTQVGLSPKRSNKTPNSVHPEPSRSDQVGSKSLLDGSAEVSWLIPATPEPSTRTSSTQTSSSMRRTQLFPRSHCSSSSSFSFSISDNPKTASCSNSLKEPHREHSQPSPAFQKLTSHSRLSKTSHCDSVNQTYHNSASEPCSSTPLHSDPRLHHLDALGSPLLRDSELRSQRRAGQEDRLGSLRLGPSENSSSPRRISQSEKEPTTSPVRSQHCDNPGDTGDQEMSTEEKEPVETRTSKTNEVEVMEEGVSFVFDEPPIAFNDSWGLGEAVADQGPCLSLRLESSGDQTSPSEQSGQGETASPHTISPPGPQRNLPDPGAAHDHSLPDAAIWDSWKEDDEDEEVDALPLSQRVGAVALTKRVSQLRTPGNKVLA